MSAPREAAELPDDDLDMLRRAWRSLHPSNPDAMLRAAELRTLRSAWREMPIPRRRRARMLPLLACAALLLIAIGLRVQAPPANGPGDRAGAAGGEAALASLVTSVLLASDGALARLSPVANPLHSAPAAGDSARARLDAALERNRSGRWSDAVRLADQVLASAQASESERCEALTNLVHARLGIGHRDDAEVARRQLEDELRAMPGK